MGLNPGGVLRWAEFDRGSPESGRDLGVSFSSPYAYSLRARERGVSCASDFDLFFKEDFYEKIQQDKLTHIRLENGILQVLLVSCRTTSIFYSRIHPSGRNYQYVLSVTLRNAKFPKIGHPPSLCHAMSQPNPPRSSLIANCLHPPSTLRNANPSF